jgi:hypothetical protein
MLIFRTSSRDFFAAEQGDQVGGDRGGEAGQGEPDGRTAKAASTTAPASAPAAAAGTWPRSHGPSSGGADEQQIAEDYEPLDGQDDDRGIARFGAVENTPRDRRPRNVTASSTATVATRPTPAVRLTARLERPAARLTEPVTRLAFRA